MVEGGYRPLSSHSAPLSSPSPPAQQPPTASAKIKQIKHHYSCQSRGRPLKWFHVNYHNGLLLKAAVFLIYSMKKHFWPRLAGFFFFSSASCCTRETGFHYAGAQFASKCAFTDSWLNSKTRLPKRLFSHWALVWDFQFSHKSPLISRHFIIYKKTFPSLCAPGVKTLVALPDSHIQPYASNVACPVGGGGKKNLLHPLVVSP